MLSDKQLSKLQRWILLKAYGQICDDKPMKIFRAPIINDKPVHLLRIDVIRDYFKLPVRTQRDAYSYDGHLVIDTGATDPGKAAVAHASLTRSLHRLTERGLIEDLPAIKLTPKGIEIAKKLSY